MNHDKREEALGQTGRLLRSERNMREAMDDPVSSEKRQHERITTYLRTALDEIAELGCFDLFDTIQVVGKAEVGNERGHIDFSISKSDLHRDFFGVIERYKDGLRLDIESLRKKALAKEAEDWLANPKEAP